MFVTEGVFNAFFIDGVATLKNSISEGQLHWLSKSTRPKVIVPDLEGDGDKLANQAIELGWSISIPDIGDCKDINQAVQRYGKLFVVKSLYENIVSGLQAKINTQVLCR